LGDRDTGILRLTSGKPSDVAQMDDTITCTIDRHAPFDLPANALDISLDPKLPSARDVRVTLMRDPSKAKNNIHYFDGPTLKDDGSFVAGYTVSGQVIPGRLYRAGSAVNLLLLGGPGSGKGGGTRTSVLESAMAKRTRPDGTVEGLVYRVGIDGKNGAGMPELAGLFDVYIKDEDQWKIGLEIAGAVLLTRLKRYGDAGRSRWHPSIDPLLEVTIDEIVAVAQKYPRYCSIMERYVAQGRSLGCRKVGNTQRGGGGDMWSTRYRGNLRGNGAIGIGQQGDTTVGMLATQDTMVDLTKLPQAPGYMFMVSKVDQDIPLIPFRYRYSVSAEEHELDGIPLGPAGATVEDWASSDLIQWATLHEQDLEAIAPWIERLGRSVDDMPEEPSDEDAADAGVAIVTGNASPSEPWWQQIKTESDLDKALQAANDSMQKTYAALPEVGTVTVQHIAATAGVSERQARNLLNTLAEPNASDRGPLAVKVDTNAWRKAS
jgi:hypothetical protein